jgi:hypothetical protein
MNVNSSCNIKAYIRRTWNHLLVQMQTYRHAGRTYSFITLLDREDVLEYSKNCKFNIRATLDMHRKRTFINFTSRWKGLIDGSRCVLCNCCKWQFRGCRHVGKRACWPFTADKTSTPGGRLVGNSDLRERKSARFF